MPLRRLLSGIAIVVMVAGCGSSTPAATTAPGGSVAVSAAPTSAVATAGPTAPPASVGALASFAGDPDLAAKFPKEVAGKPVTNVTTVRLADFMAAFQASQDQVDKLRQDLASVGVDMNSVVVGFGQATVGTASVQIEATRAPGMDAAKLIPVVIGLGATNTGDKVTQETVGGKSASVVRSEGGYASDWLYANGDIIWQLSTSNQKAAEAIFATLP